MLIEKTVGLRVLFSFVAVIVLAVFGIVSCGGSTNNNVQSRYLSPVSGSEGNSNQMGINIAAPIDYEIDRLYANAISTSRKFVAGASENGTVDAQIDPVDFWPTEDFAFYVWGSGEKKNGTYSLSFKGKANVSRNPGGVIPVTYDLATNTSTGTFQIVPANASSTLALIFANTQRTDTSAVGTGVASIKLMRPLSLGSTQTYPTATLFTDPIKALIAKFSVIRFMDFLATNSSQQKNWTDRPLPTWPSFNRYARTNGYGWQGIGGPWEHVSLLANETGKDAWINIPVDATDAFVTNVARTLAYGSDGVTPYTSAQINPVYPPLNANLKIYVEYSNELWNTAGAFTQSANVCQAASDELVAGNSPLNWDSSWNSVTYPNATWNYTFCYRNIAKRGIEISNIFRSVFGDAAMGIRIRPVLMTQLGAATRVLAPAMKMMLEYYDNMGGNFVSTPHSPNYYFYGAGGSAYYNPASTITTLEELFADPGMTPSGSFATAVQGDAKLVAALGLKRVAYEGGPSLDTIGGNGVRDAVSAQAVNDTRMTSAIINQQNDWSRNGGELLVYYRATGDYQWGFTPDIYNFATPKLLAIDALNTASRTPITFGAAFPGSVNGIASDTCSNIYNCNRNGFGGGGIVWASYSFHSTESSPWFVNVSVSGATNASVAVYVDGNLIGTQTTTGGTLSFEAGTVAEGLHGVIVRSAAGTFIVGSVAVAPKLR